MRKEHLHLHAKCHDAVVEHFCLIYVTDHQFGVKGVVNLVFAVN
jgi:hypothetical protein